MALNLPTNVWINADGLVVKLGTSEGTVDKGGEFEDISNGSHVEQLGFTFSDFTGSTSTKPNVPGSGTGLVLPKGAQISKVEIYSESGWTATGGTIDIGLAKESDYATVIDNQGIVKAASQTGTIATQGNLLVINNPGDTAAGTLVGTVLSYASVVTCNYNTNAPTAGKILVRIHWYMPITKS